MDWFAAYGYWVVFIGCLLESTIFIGLIVTGDVLLLAASFFASQGNFNLFLVILVGILGSLLGSNIGYLLGYRGGRPFIEKYGHYFFIPATRIKKTEEYFDSHGPKTVFFGRFAAGIKAFISALAGAAHMDYLTFLLYTTSATVVWVSGVCLLGFFFGKNWSFLVKVLGGFGWLILIVIVLLVLAIYGYRRFLKLR